MQSIMLIEANGQGTLCIAACFILIAYFIHPLVEGAFYRVRAYRAWMAIERKETVEVTRRSLLSLFAELLKGRGKWDAARLVALLLACFSIASWGLELSLDLADETRGPVDMMDRPPPVFLREGSDDDAGIAWHVLDGSSFDKGDRTGTLGNFRGTFEAGNAMSRCVRVALRGERVATLRG